MKSTILDKKKLNESLLFFDGGTGTVLQKWGLKPGELPETWNINHPEKIQQLHYEYYCAGANIIKTNTFGAFITKFPLNLEKIIKSGIENANGIIPSSIDAGTYTINVTGKKTIKNYIKIPLQWSISC